MFVFALYTSLKYIQSVVEPSRFCASPVHCPICDCADAIPQWPLSQIEHIVKTALRQQLGLEYEQVFESMDDVAVGSASIGQVHVATLTPKSAQRCNLGDHKRRVAVKVMHPGAKQRFAHDCQVVRWLCRVALPGWSQILDEYEKQVRREFDYRREARDMEEMRQNVLKSPYASEVCIPRPELALCCDNVLVMELLDGVKLVDAMHNGLTRALGSNRDKARALIREQQEKVLLGKPGKDDGGMGHPRPRHEYVHGISTAVKMGLLQRRYQRRVQLLLAVHGYQMFVNGCYNADPHPGTFQQKQQ